jgi:hypothetical protein
MNTRISFTGLMLSGAFVVFAGYVIVDSMTCSASYCQWLLFLPAVSWSLLILVFGSILPPVVNNTLGWLGILINTILTYLLGARLEKIIRRKLP